jgi:prepilin-type processing-associated H-X9-DG protein
MVPLLPYVEQNSILGVYVANVDWSDPRNATALTIKFSLFRCPSSPTSDELVLAYNSSYISPGNDAFAPPAGSGSGTNIFGQPVYPTTANTSTGWTSDYAPLAQVKTSKDATGAEVAFSNPLLAALNANGRPSKGALRQNGTTPILDIVDGTSNTTLYSEAAGRDMQYFANRVAVPYDTTKITGPIWADSDNRLTVTGTDATGTASIGTGPCVMNCNNLAGDIYSFHTGGANVVFADGSVRFVRDTITITTLAALVTKAGGEVVDPGSY